MEADVTDIYTISRALLKIQLAKGCPSRIFTLGPMATRVRDLLQEQKDQVGETFFPEDTQFDDLFIIDRTSDLITPLLTQLSYGGYLDDKFGIDWGRMPSPIDGEVIDLDDPKDEVFAGARGMAVSEVGQYMFDRSRELSQISEKMQESLGTSKWGVHGQRAKKLIDLKPLAELHVNLCKKALDSRSWFELKAFQQEFSLLNGTAEDNRDLVCELLNFGKLKDALRLLCLESLTSRGVREKTLLEVQKRLFGEFGFAAQQDLINLEKCGLVQQGSALGPLQLGGKPKFDAVRKKFDLIMGAGARKSDVEEMAPTVDVDDLYGKFVPLLVRFVQMGMMGQWEKGASIEKLMTELGLQFDIVSGKAESHGEDRVRRALVFVVGGMTMTESLLFGSLGRVFEDRVEFHVGSTSLITSGRLLKEVCPVSGKSI
jgi:hypothetical protein